MYTSLFILSTLYSRGFWFLTNVNSDNPDDEEEFLSDDIHLQTGILINKEVVKKVYKLVSFCDGSVCGKSIYLPAPILISIFLLYNGVNGGSSFRGDLV